MAGKKKDITVGDLNRIPMWGVLKTPYGFSIRRVLGGFIYEYPNAGQVVFISTDEFRNE